MMRISLLAALLFALALHAVGAQDPTAERTDQEFGGWKTVLGPGTLGRNPDIVPVEGGFAVSAESFADPTWTFDADWIRYDPQTGKWSDYETTPDKRALLDINEELLELLDIADMVPDDPRIKYQLVDGGKKLAFLLPDDYEFDALSLYTTALIVNPVAKTASAEYVWYCQGPPNAELVVWDFPDQSLSVICNAIIHHVGGSIRTERTYNFVGSLKQGPLYLFSHSPDNRYWILGRDELFSETSGPFYLYDRQTEHITIMLWRLPHKPKHDFIAWLSSSSLLVNVGQYILHLDLANRMRHELLREELAMLSEATAFMAPVPSADGQCLLVAAEDGSLLLRNVFDTLADVGFSNVDGSAD